MESDNKKVFNNLSIKDKEHVMMYISARQFKNAVPIEEMLIIPSRIGNWVEKTNVKINNIDLKDLILLRGIEDNSPIKQNGITMVTARGDKIISKQFPFIVNKSFACEIYFKLFLEEYNINWHTLKNGEKHNLWKLYFLIPDDLKKDLNICLKLKGYINVDDSIKKISDAFINWRYIYQKYKEIDSLDFLFLNELCNYLDNKAKNIILNNYNYDVEKDVR